MQIFHGGDAARDILSNAAQIKGHDIFRCEAGVDALQLGEAAHEQCGAANDDDGEGDFGDDKCGAEAVTAAAVAAAAATLLQRAGQIDAPRLPGRHEAAEDSCERGDAEGEENCGGVERDFRAARNIRGRHGE